MNLFQILSFLLVLTVLILILRYAWGIFFDSNYKPVEWQHAVRHGMISKELNQLERNYPDKVRFFNWWFQVERLKKDGVPGDFAELGVYKGESAKIIHLMDPSRTFHLYDTFEGFQVEDLKVETGEAATYTTKNFADTSLEAVKRYLGEGGRFVYHVGRFSQLDNWTVGQLDKNIRNSEEITNNNPEDSPTDTSPIVQLSNCPTVQLSNCPTVQLSNCPTVQLQLALAHLDADLYNPTKAGLDYFYPLLSPGGVIIIHDYTYKWPGVKRAVDEFVNTIPEPLVIVPDMDGSVMIVKSAT